MIALNILGGLLIGNGLSGLYILALAAGRPLFNAHVCLAEVIVGGLMLLVRAFQIGRDSK